PAGPYGAARSARAGSCSAQERKSGRPSPNRFRPRQRSPASGAARGCPAMALSRGLPRELAEAVAGGRVLVVGAGGIGCELLKNLVLTGFSHIDLIDLDTIDVSNLNRQFLFQKKHVGRSKAQVAKESVLQFYPKANIIAYHDSIMNPDYNVEFFRQFILVMNALDNRAARNHVNRMCLAADVPLIESGTAGYLGQVTTIKKGVTECYECHPKPTQRTFPGCTIRNTPSEPIHCIVWAKYLFNQLFGEEDADQEVSPDRADPEASWEPMEAEARARASNEDGDIKRISTKEWAKSTGYDPVKLFTKLFKDDIRYLLTMDKLWRKRKPPVPLDWAEVQSQGEETNASDQQNEPQLGLKDQQVLDVKSYARLFSKSIETLRVNLAEKGDGAELIWDKDDPSAMDFVTSAANLRMHIFSMNMKSRFDIKSMAGNIIPAIATTNAVIAGLIVLEGLKILSGKIDQCRTIFLNKQPNPRKKLLVPCALDPPNPNCYVCASKPEVTVRMNVHKVTVLTLQDKIVKEKFAMVAPDVQIEDGKGTILISSEEGETEANNHKKLSEFGIRNGSRLQADDFLQDYTLLINILHSEDLGKDVEFEVVGDAPEKVGPKQAEDAAKSITNGSDDGAQPSTSTAQEQDDVLIVDSDEEGPSNNADISEEERSRKRKLDEKENVGAKRSRTEQAGELDDRSRAAADDAAVLLAGLALREPEPGGDSPGRGRRGPRPGPGDEAAPARGRRGKGGGGGPEAGADGPSRGERGPRRAGPTELSAPPAGSPRASLAGSDGGGGSARSSGISLGYDQRHGSPRPGRSDPRPGPGPPSVGSARSSVSSLGSRGSAGAYADLLLPGVGPAPARSPEPAGPAPFPLPSLQLPPGREGGPSAAERRLEALTRELERALEARSARDYFGICIKCGLGIYGARQACQAMGSLYHTDCFTCDSCGRRLRGKAFYNVGEKVYCQEDFLVRGPRPQPALWVGVGRDSWFTRTQDGAPLRAAVPAGPDALARPFQYSGFQQTADKCSVCGHLIMEMILQALGKSYHPGCFRCSVCHECLDGVPFTVDVDGNIYCVRDYHTVFAPKCASCARPILPAQGCGTTVRVVSMDRDYHVQCYRCEDCGLQLSGDEGRRCYPLEGHLLCRRCHLRRLRPGPLPPPAVQVTEL
ncbi:SUMO-activating enzyme subunit 2, partial [Galemys pyrenaicus]